MSGITRLKSAPQGHRLPHPRAADLTRVPKAHRKGKLVWSTHRDPQVFPEQREPCTQQAVTQLPSGAGQTNGRKRRKNGLCASGTIQKNAPSLPCGKTIGVTGDLCVSHRRLSKWTRRERRDCTCNLSTREAGEGGSGIQGGVPLRPPPSRSGQ